MIEDDPYAQHGSKGDVPRPMETVSGWINPWERSEKHHFPTKGEDIRVLISPWLWPTSGATKRIRFVVVRSLIPEDLTEQLTRFSMGKYSDQVIMTNMKLTPFNTWRFYNGRAAVELKGDYPLGKIPTKHFAANEAYFHTLLFSYNLINCSNDYLCQRSFKIDG